MPLLKLYEIYDKILDLQGPEKWNTPFHINLAEDFPELNHATLIEELDHLHYIGWVVTLNQSGDNVRKIQVTCEPTYGLSRILDFYKPRNQPTKTTTIADKLRQFQEIEDRKILPPIWQSNKTKQGNIRPLHISPIDAEIMKQKFFVGQRYLTQQLTKKLEEESIIEVISPHSAGKSSLVGWALSRIVAQEDNDLDIFWVTLNRKRQSMEDILIDFVSRVGDITKFELKQERSLEVLVDSLVRLLQTKHYIIVINNADGLKNTPSPSSSKRIDPFDIFSLLANRDLGQSCIIFISDQGVWKEQQPVIEVDRLPLGYEIRQFIFDLYIESLLEASQETEDIYKLLKDEKNHNTLGQLTWGDPSTLEIGRGTWPDGEHLSNISTYSTAIGIAKNEFQELDETKQAILRVIVVLSKSRDVTIKQLSDILEELLGSVPSSLQQDINSLHDHIPALIKIVDNKETNNTNYHVHSTIEKYLSYESSEDSALVTIHELCMNYYWPDVVPTDIDDEYIHEIQTTIIHAREGRFLEKLAELITQLNTELPSDIYKDIMRDMGSPDVSEWTKSVCRFCGVGCGIMIGTNDFGELLQVKGDLDHPSTLGKICGKAFALPEIVASTNRLTTPQIKSPETGELEDATWDEAMSLIAEKFAAAIDEDPDSVAYYGSGQAMSEESYFAARLFRGGIGTNNVDGNPRLCMASSVGGFMTTYGLDEPMGNYQDIDHAETFFLVGSNIVECHPVLWYFLLNRVREGEKQGKKINVIVMDPRKVDKLHNVTDIYMGLRPGTDVAVLNSMAYVIIEEGLYDQDFVKAHTKFRSQDKENCNFGDYKEFLKDFTPKKVARDAGISVQDIKEAARLFAKGPTVSMWSMGINQHTTGVWGNNLIHNLHLLTGNIGKLGATPLSLTGQPNACGGVRDAGVLAHLLPYGRLVNNETHRNEMENIWGLKKGSLSSIPGTHATQLFADMKPDPAGENTRKKLKAVMVLTTNPGQSLPNLGKYRERLKDKDSFLVVLDSFPTRTTEVADVVLPAAMWSEKDGVYGMTERRYQLMPKVTEPPQGARPDLDILIDFAQRLQSKDVLFPEFSTENFETAEDVWKEMMEASENTAYDFSGMTRKRLEEEHGLCWPVPTLDHPGTKSRYVKGDPDAENAYDRGDPLLNSGRYEQPDMEKGDIRFYGHEDGRAIIWLRPMKWPEELPQGKQPSNYPFILTTGRVLEHWHTGTMTMESPKLSDAAPAAFIEIHSEDARQLNIHDDDKVRITSLRSEEEEIPEIIIPAKVVETIRIGTVFVPFHWDDDHSMINYLTTDAIDPISKQPEFKVCAVNLEKVTTSL